MWVVYLHADTVGLEKTWQSIPQSDSIQEYAQTEQTIYTPAQESQEWVTPINPSDTIDTSSPTTTPTDIEELPMATIVPMEPTQEIISTTPTVTKQVKVPTVQKPTSQPHTDNYLVKIKNFLQPIWKFFDDYTAQFFTLITGVFILFYLLLYLPLRRRVRREEDEDIPVFVDVTPPHTKKSFI